jgi:hypothetical protein
VDIVNMLINRWLLKTYIFHFLNQTKELVALLLNPKDPQDIPCTIELIRALAYSIIKNEYS